MLSAVLGLAISCGSSGPSGTAATTNLAPPNFKLAATVPLPGSGGHGDLVVYDTAKKLVYLAHHGDDLVVIDPTTKKITADVKVGADPNGVAFDGSYLYVTTGGANTIAVVSLSDWKVVKQVTSKDTSPDGIWLDPGSQKLYVISDDGNDVMVFTAGSNPTQTGTIALLPEKPTSGPDVGVLVPSKKRLYEPDDSLVEIVDLTSGKVTKSVDTKLPIAKNGATKNMVYDPKTNHLWVATTAKKVLIMDADTLETVGSIPATASDDQMAIDPGRRLIYAFGGTGFDAFDADKMTLVASVDTGSKTTHTGAVNPDTHDVYVYEGDANLVGIYRP
jgi:YVTN family beta-propeller protein